MTEIVKKKRKAKMANNPITKKRDGTIITKRIQGDTMREIAADLNISLTTVHRILTTDEALARLDQARTRYILMLDKAAQAHERCLDSQNEMTALRAAQDIVKIVGFLSTNTPAQSSPLVYINNLFQPGQQLAPELQMFLTAVGAQFQLPAPIPVTPRDLDTIQDAVIIDNTPKH